MKQLTFIIAVTFLFITCKKEESEQIKIDDDIIINYLTSNNIDANKHESGLYYIITKEGDKGSPNINSVIEVKYKGYLTNGTIFDERTYTSYLSNLIEGWKIGIPLLKGGGKGSFFIPSYLAYGGNVTGSIPANSVLIFDIELISFH